MKRPLLSFFIFFFFNLGSFIYFYALLTRKTEVNIYLPAKDSCISLLSSHPFGLSPPRASRGSAIHVFLVYFYALLTRKTEANICLPAKDSCGL